MAEFYDDFLGYFEKHQSSSKNCCCYFLGNLCKNLGYVLYQHLVTLFNGHPPSILSMSISSYVSLSIPSLFQKQITFSSSWNSQHHHLFIFYITHHICLLSFVFVYNLLSVFHSLLLTYQHTFLSSSKYIFFACLTFCLFAWSFTLFIFLNNLPVYLYLSFSETRTFLCLPVSVESPLFIFSPFCPSCQIHFSTCVNFQMIC